MGTHLTVKQLEGIRDGAQTKTQRQIAEELGISLASVTRIANVIREGELPKWIERAKQRDAGIVVPRGPNKILSPVAAKVRKYYQPGMSWEELGKKVGSSGNSAKYWVMKFGLDQKRTAGLAPKNQHRKTDHYSKKNPPPWLANARHLHAQGLPYRVIADRLKIKRSAVGYYLTDKRHRLEAKELELTARQPSKEQANGNLSAGPDKKIFIGYCYAKVEEFISLLAKRAGFPPELLRTRLSELLGHPSIRESSGDRD